MEEKNNVVNGKKASDEQHEEAGEKLSTSAQQADVTAPSKIRFPSCRLVLALMGFFGFINCYTLRVNLSVAIVAMVNTTYLDELEAAAAADDNANVTLVDVCAVEGDNTTHAVEEIPGPFNWNMKTQGLLLGAFFYGYTTTQILGGTLAQKIGGKMLFLFGIAWTAALTLLLPILTTVGGIPAIFVLRFLMGMGEAVTFPSMAAMLAKWAPPLERSKMTTFIFAGGQIGTVFGMPISGLLCDRFGWESVFYFFGAAGLVWAVMWFFLIYNSPAVHPRISIEECEYIEKALNTKAGAKGTVRVPWLSVARSVPMYALAVAHFTSNLGFYTLLTCLPQYFKHILHFDIKSNGVLSGAPYLFMWLFLVLSGLTADLLRNRHILSTTNVRKLMNASGFILPAVLLIATGYVDCNAALAVFLIITAVGFSGISFAGWSVNHLDLAPQYAGTLMGITNTIATFPGFIGPAVVGAITDGNQTVKAWRLVFYLGGAVYLFGTIIYALFGSGEVQPWAMPKMTEELQALGDVNRDKEKDKEKDGEPEKHMKDVV